MEAILESPKRKRKTERRGNREGSIYQQSDRRWCGRVTIGHSDTGKLKESSTPGTPLGHANIATTQRYMHLDDRELADAQDLVE